MIVGEGRGGVFRVGPRARGKIGQVGTGDFVLRGSRSGGISEKAHQEKAGHTVAMALSRGCSRQRQGVQVVEAAAECFPVRI